MSKGNSYHISIDGQGYMLKGTPKNPARKMERAPIFGNRFASGDRDYTDFSIWWYWAQTDWSGGFKDQKDWADDAKYYYSTNIDALSRVGAVRLATDIALQNTFSEAVLIGGHLSVGGAIEYFVGTEDGGADEPIVYRFTGGSWVDISSTQFNTNRTDINQVFALEEELWVLATGSDGSNLVLSWDGSWTDHSSAISAASVFSALKNATSALVVDEILYVACNDPAGDDISLMKTADNGSNWVEVLTHEANMEMNAVGEYNGNIYYILNGSSFAELWVYNVVADAKTLIKTFTDTNYQNLGAGGKYLFNEFGNLVILVPKTNNKGEIYTYNGSALVKVYEADEDKIDLGLEAYSDLTEGGVIKDNKLYCNNLVYDGVSLYNWQKPLDDDTAVALNPMFTDVNGDIWYKEDSGSVGVWADVATYRTGSDENFIIFSEFAEVSTIDKLPNAIKIIFEPFDTGEEIEVQYSTDGGSSYTILGNASYTLDGNSVTQKTFLFSGSVDFRKMFIKVLLNSDGSSTPVLLDFSLQYLPIPHYNYQWSFNINANNNIKLLDDRTNENKKGIDLRNALRASFLTKQVIDLQDVDYFETQIDGGTLSDSNTTVTVDSTDGAPEKGRLKIEQEEINYTGKTATTFTGCTRGYRGTPAKSHADDTIVSTKYRAIISDFGEENPTLDDDTAIDYTLKVNLIEV